MSSKDNLFLKPDDQSGKQLILPLVKLFGEDQFLNAAAKDSKKVGSKQLVYSPICLNTDELKLLSPLYNQGKSEVKYLPLKLDFAELMRSSEKKQNVRKSARLSIKSSYRRTTGTCQQKVKPEVSHAAINSNGKRKLNTGNSSTKKPNSETSSKISSGKKVKTNYAGINFKAKKKLFTQPEDHKTKPSSLNTAIHTAIYSEEPKLLQLDVGDLSSGSEFEKNEMQCGVVHSHNVAESSPVSSIINSLQKTTISKDHDLFETIDKIKSTIETKFNAFQKKQDDNWAAAIAALQQSQQRMEDDRKTFMCQIMNDLHKLDYIKKKVQVDMTNKENSGYKTVRLASPPRKQFTPKSKRSSLRVATLNKLHKSAKKDNNSCDLKMEKAMNFYNTMRRDHGGVLATPKANRQELMNPSGIGENSVSVNLQRQCLMLVDTPLRN